VVAPVEAQMDAFADPRRSMVEEQLAARGITAIAVLRAMLAVPRESFVPRELAEMAHSDRPLPIGRGQTISQPYIVALMAQALELGPHDRVLEIGTGSGYAAAVLACIAHEVYTIEVDPVLAASARERLQALGFDNVHVSCADGTLGWPGAGPFEAIQLTAAGNSIPIPLLDQLEDGGRLVAPVGPAGAQELIRVVRDGDHLRTDDLGPVSFVPLVHAGQP
jgi:protein-L-isoaspartate(D-aspartate) O-methyltransferase